MRNIQKLVFGLYVGIACLTLVFQAYIRMSQCAGTAACTLSIGKGAIWSAAWPASWAVFAYGRVNGGEHAALEAGQAAKGAVDAEWYLSQYPDVRAAVQSGQFKSAEEHYRTIGFKEKRLPTKPKVDVNGGEHAALEADQAAKVAVDAEWYLSQYPDVRAAVQSGQFKSAEEHYRTIGFKEKRFPTKPKVDEEFYLRTNPDVAAAVRSGKFTSGYEHYFTNGYREGRKPLP